MSLQATDPVRHLVVDGSKHLYLIAMVQVTAAGTGETDSLLPSPRQGHVMHSTAPLDLGRSMFQPLALQVLSRLATQAMNQLPNTLGSTIALSQDHAQLVKILSLVMLAKK